MIFTLLQEIQSDFETYYVQVIIGGEVVELAFPQKPTPEELQAAVDALAAVSLEVS
jgi:hypothetical protein